MIKLENVSKRFGQITALENINLEVQKGEILTIIGPNGSGKTTMLRIIAGIEEPTSGKVYFDGQLITEDSFFDVRQRCTLVFQNVVLFSTTVKKNVAYGLELRGQRREEVDRRVKEALEIVKLSGYEDRSAKELSGGEQQRVSLARALALNADVLLLDEPTANLDPKNASIIEETISRVNRERETTVVMATHNMFQAEILTHRAALLIAGRTVQVGTPKQIFRTPSEYLASFARLENVFSGVSKVLESGTFVIELENSLSIEAAAGRKGKVTAHVRPEDIILSRERITSSARNVFKGEVTGVSDFGGTVRLNVDAGKPFVVQITKRSFKEMELNIGSQVHLTFKASAVRMI